MLAKNLQETIKTGARGAAVMQLQSALNVIGAALVVDGIFGPTTDDTVRDFQAYAGLVEDGIVGPKTWKALEQALARRAYMQSVAKVDRLKAAGEKAVERALKLWETDIYDPKPVDNTPDAKRCKAMILKFIQDGLGWRWIKEYGGDGKFEWCLAFASFCWSDDLKESFRAVYGASTYRWDRAGSYESAFGEANPKPENEADRRLYMTCDESTKADSLPWEPRPGDIALVGKKGYGVHGVLVEGFDKERGCLRTVEGNAHGTGPNGERQQGVIITERFFGGHAAKGSTHVRRVVRPGSADLR